MLTYTVDSDFLIISCGLLVRQHRKLQVTSIFVLPVAIRSSFHDTAAEVRPSGLCCHRSDGLELAACSSARSNTEFWQLQNCTENTLFSVLRHVVH